jgi:hypothetical protein
MICLLGCNGCGPLENITSDVGGWNLSACVSDFGTCWELFLDNRDKFADGFVSAMNTLEGG